jgi:hypothetical protein
MRNAECGIRSKISTTNEGECGIWIAEYYLLVFLRAVLIEETVMARI